MPGPVLVRGDVVLHHKCTVIVALKHDRVLHRCRAQGREGGVEWAPQVGTPRLRILQSPGDSTTGRSKEAEYAEYAGHGGYAMQGMRVGGLIQNESVSIRCSSDRVDSIFIGALQQRREGAGDG